MASAPVSVLLTMSASRSSHEPYPRSLKQHADRCDQQGVDGLEEKREVTRATRHDELS